MTGEEPTTTPDDSRRPSVGDTDEGADTTLPLSLSRRGVLQLTTGVALGGAAVGGVSARGRTSNNRLSFEDASVGDTTPPSPWYELDNYGGEIQISDERCTDGTNSLYIAGEGGGTNDNAQRDVNIAVDIDVTSVNEIRVDTFVEQNRSSSGELQAHLIEAGNYTGNQIMGWTIGPTGWYRDSSADVSDMTGERVFYLHADGSGNRGYFDNIRFYDEDGELLPVSDVLLRLGDDDGGGGDGADNNWVVLDDFEATDTLDWQILRGERNDLAFTTESIEGSSALYSKDVNNSVYLEKSPSAAQPIDELTFWFKYNSQFDNNLQIWLDGPSGAITQFRVFSGGAYYREPPNTIDNKRLTSISQGTWYRVRFYNIDFDSNSYSLAIEDADSNQLATQDNIDFYTDVNEWGGFRVRNRLGNNGYADPLWIDEIRYVPAEGAGVGEDITPPSAAFDYSVPNVDSFPAPEAGEAVLFDASASSDPDGTITTYDWDFDNDASFEAQGRSAEHTYRTVGAKSPALRVTDTDGATADTSRSLTVELPGRRRKLALAQNIDDLSLLSDIEALTGEDLTGDLELSQQTLTALREAVADGTLDRSVAENAIRRLQASEEVTRNLLTRLGPAGVDGNLARQLVRKAIETVVTLIAVAISIKASAIIGGGIVGAAATFVVDELLDAATFVLGDWLAADSEGNDGYRQQVDRQCREMSNSLVNDIKNGVVSGPAAIADAIEDIIDTLVETAADGLRTVIELDLADDIVGSVPVPQMQVLGAGEAIYGSLNQLNDSFRPDAIAGGLQGTTSGAETAIADGESVMFDAISLTSDFITNLSEITADLTSLAETVDDIINGNISARRAVFEIGAGLVTAVLKGFVGAVTGAIGAAVGGPLVAFIKTVHSQIVQSAIRGESVGFTTL